MKTPARLKSEDWVSLLPRDSRPWLLSSEEPAARFIALTGLEGRPAEDPDVRAARTAVLADPGTKTLFSFLPNWEKEAVVSGHHSPSFAPNILHLLADHGVGPGDVPSIERLLDQMLAHQDDEGRFQTLGRQRDASKAVWGALFCDAHAILEVLIRFGRMEDPRTRRALKRMASDLSPTSQGPGWLCRRDPASGWRGPGRKDDVCPMVTLEALRSFARLSEKDRPSGLIEAARTCLRAWRERVSEKPYMFGHGRQFKTVKWPSFWYNGGWVLDTLSRYPALWKGRAARNEDRGALSELAACLVAYNFDAEGKVVPRSCYQGFESFSFGQKKIPSPFATASLCLPLRRLSDLSDEIAAVDVFKLRSSKGGSGTPLPPKSRGPLRESGSARDGLWVRGD
jgi:hypothetical protein